MFTNTQLEVDALPKAEHIIMRPISPKYITVLFINLSIAYIIIFSTVFILKYTTDIFVTSFYFWLSILTIILLSVIHFVFTVLNFKTRKYALREKDILFSKGYINHKITTLPFNRVQHIEISRSFIARKLGLSTLKIYSAGESGGDISIAGLPKAIADKQYAFLTRILNERL